MSRRGDQIDRIEASLARLEQALAGHAGAIRDQLASVRLDASSARSTAQSVHAGVQALADMLATIPQANPQPPSAVPPAAGGSTGEGPVTAARRAPTEPAERMLDGRGNTMTGGTRGANGRFRRTPAAATRDMRAAELHGQGWTHERIAAELGYASRGKVSDAIDRAYQMIVTPGAAEAKRTDLERLDRLIEKNWEALERQHVAVSNGRVVRRFVGVERHEDGIEKLDPDGKPIPVFEDVLDDGPIAAHSMVILQILKQRDRMYGYAEPARSRVEVITADMVESHIADLESQLARNDPADTSRA